MGDDDEGWGQGGPGVVLHDQVVALELPVGVTVLLHFGEGVAGDREGRRDTRVQNKPRIEYRIAWFPV